jgi:ferredoxin-NADP reductase/mono/diheme cytochrome c family protein
MLTTSVSLWLGLVFVVLGGVNVWLVLESWSRVKAGGASSRMLTLHRIGGYVFIALFCVMTYYMLARLSGGGTDISPTATLHLALALILSPLLFIKVLIARYYKNQQNLLLPIGLAIFVLAFVLIASTAAPYFARTSKIEQVSIDPAHVPAVLVDLNLASDLLQKRCSKCHTLDRVVGARKDAQGWIATVDRMRQMPSAEISGADAQAIVAFLTSQARPKGNEDAEKMQVARALVDQRCGRCHSLDRVYKAVETPDQWREIVTRMVGYAAGSTGALQAGEDQKIIEYLSATQTPEAAARRKAQTDAAASAGQSLIAQNSPASSSLARPAKESQYDAKAIGFISFVGLVSLGLVLRRPGARMAAPAKAPAVQGKAPSLPLKSASSSSFVLELIHITPQTPDAKTLRFAVNGERKLDARPGQFLTFSFLFDGKKETRCYSICSSPARSGYVEITPKRVNNGCVSVFLNDRASVGMTVEVTGPFGQFYHTPAIEKKIVLLAAGSGITPMISMLRNLDDLCLDTYATLLYCARTREDIIFAREFEDLKTRLKNFEYHFLLSKPDSEWTGLSGHISREFIRAAVPDVNGRMFFLCGPPPFMETTRRILLDMEVAAERIRQETFGGAGASPKAAESQSAATGFTIEFTSSGKSAPVLEGQTLLEAAAAAGVDIPSACRQGQCGTCKTRLLSGDVQMAADQGLDAESKARGYVLTCVGRAVGSVRLDA